MGIWKSKDPVVHGIKAEELKKIVNKPGLEIINVLDKEYYEDCAIPGSINVPLAQLKIKTKEWPKHKELVVYCAHVDCPLSKKAVKKLAEMGYTNVRAYEGGMKEWKAKGWDCEGPCALTYLHD
jgi:rhodanese-related sulfurtransferase